MAVLLLKSKFKKKDVDAGRHRGIWLEALILKDSDVV